MRGWGWVQGVGVGGGGASRTDSGLPQEGGDVKQAVAEVEVDVEAAEADERGGGCT